MSGARGDSNPTPSLASGPKPGASTNFATRGIGDGLDGKPPPILAGCQASRPRRAGLTRNRAAYIAGSASSVSAVATISPPMMATAIGPQNTLRDSGIIASTAAAAVRMMGGSAAPPLDDRIPGGDAALAVVLDLVDQDHRVAHDHAHQRDHAQQRHEAEGPVQQQQRAATPAMPIGPVRNTSTARLKLCSCSISSVNMMNSITGAPAAMEPLALLLLHGAGPPSMR